MLVDQLCGLLKLSWHFKPGVSNSVTSNMVNNATSACSGRMWVVALVVRRAISRT